LQALNQLTKNIAVEWAKDGIRANAVAPWYTATPLAMQVWINMKVYMPSRPYDEQQCPCRGGLPCLPWIISMVL